MEDEVDWFPSLTAVPGIRWEPPAGVEPDPRWVGVEPRRGAEFAPPGWLEWVHPDAGRKGDMKASPWTSPCAALSETVYDAQDPEDVFRLTCQALLAPGLREDYLEAVRFGTTHLQMKRASAEDLLVIQEAGIALIEADPEGARVAKRRTARNAEEVLREPFATMQEILMTSGLVREAADVERREEQALGSYAGPAPRTARTTVETLEQLWREHEPR